ncbi:unnamed protein product [Cylicostephanus goldi]|uniref:IGFBP N-terminal domain-containing protein n=1 Tax=Cylicostephanus goldi TaxID=71465 RepID=A0A3P6SDH9_CYLGO|nr:unnamed protein product [Cylicostephanus goldi]
MKVSIKRAYMLNFKMFRFVFFVLCSFLFFSNANAFGFGLGGGGGSSCCPPPAPCCPPPAPPPAPCCPPPAPSCGGGCGK